MIRRRLCPEKKMKAELRLINCTKVLKKGKSIYFDVVINVFFLFAKFGGGVGEWVSEWLAGWLTGLVKGVQLVV